MTGRHLPNRWSRAFLAATALAATSAPQTSSDLLAGPSAKTTYPAHRLFQRRLACRREAGHTFSPQPSAYRLHRIWVTIIPAGHFFSQTFFTNGTFSSSRAPPSAPWPTAYGYAISLSATPSFKCLGTATTPFASRSPPPFRNSPLRAETRNTPPQFLTLGGPAPALFRFTNGTPLSAGPNTSMATNTAVGRFHSCEFFQRRLRIRTFFDKRSPNCLFDSVWPRFDDCIPRPGFSCCSSTPVPTGGPEPEPVPNPRLDLPR